MVQYTIRMGRLVVGLMLLVAGGILALPGVPGPGLVVIFLGLTMLSHEFHWARRVRDRMRATYDRVTRRRDGAG
jgi:uncharacterized protein (TIGR02611 family)